ncbi:transporter [Roseibium sp.]|uniref:SphA family protein n=1 Tax=Roseibium sp. TaxID=1936156 RepID=UPI00329A3AB9
MKINSRIAATAVLVAVSTQQASAVEGGLGAYLPGSRTSFAGIVPGPGSYVGLDLVTSSGSVTGLSLGGLPIRADTDLKLSFAKFSYTYVFDAALWGGTPAININIPFVIDANLTFTGITPPLVGVPIDDTTSGVGDITITPMVGWHSGMLHYSAGFSIFAPTGSYSTASIDIPNRTINALNTGKNIWSFQPVFAVTHMNPDTGLEFSGAASLLFSTRNKATDYQNAPALNLEGAVMQHLPSGWAFGAVGYVYQQLDDDSGSGAAATKAALGASSLQARVFGAGPMITYSGATIFGQQASFQFKYLTEFGAKRRFESDTLWLNFAITF